MADVKRKDLNLGYRFELEIEGISNGGFSEVSGLDVETEVESYQEGGLNEYVHQLAKGTKYTNITLKRGFLDIDLFTWYSNVIKGKIKRKTINIKQLNYKKQTVWQWNIKEAYPVKWKGPEFKASGNEVTFESLEFVHNGYEFNR